MPDFLEEKRREIQARMDELKPLVEEYGRLEAAVAALGDVAAPSAGRAPAAVKAPARRAPRKRSTAAAPAAKRGGTGAKRGRPKGSGKRAKEALQIVKDNPGITIPAIADKMGMKQNYLYRVLPSLAADGLVKKDGRGWSATG